MRTEQQERKVQFLRELRRRLGVLEDKACNHCGHDEAVDDMFRYEEKLVEFIVKEMEAASNAEQFR